MKELCEIYGKSRQAWYKSQQKEQLEEYHADLIEQEVKRIRTFMPRLGARKLYKKQILRTLLQDTAFENKFRIVQK